jgi:WhiB family transcriptional regulator, redox-sensing transcriptional regulator
MSIEYPSLVDSRSAWMRFAACRSAPTSDFFPAMMSDVGAARAVSICNRCPVQDECARYAIVNNIEYGIWGGLSPRARREIASSAKKQDRTREMTTFECYTRHREAGRLDPVKATSIELNISTATVYHHVRIIKFKRLAEML